MVKSRHIMAPKRFWTAAETDMLRRCYADTLTTALAAELGCTVRRVLQKAKALGLRKNVALIAQTARERSMQPGHGGRRTQIKPGQVPWNKGVPGSTGLHPNTRAHHFKPGAKPYNTWLPVGSYRVDHDGVAQVKVNDDPGPSKVRWKSVHRLVWAAAHGPIPPGHAVVFKAGCKTSDPAAITVDMLELLTRQQLMQRNSVHTNYPPELARLVQLRGVLNRAINDRAKKAAA